MQEKNIYNITKEGYEKMKKELDLLKNEKLPAVISKLKIAIEQGDLSENAEYEQAMEEKNIIENRIKEIEHFLLNAKIIEEADIDKVGYGNKVTLLINGKEETYEIVGSEEVDILNNKISLSSPLGQALKGKKVGAKVIVDSPKGEYEVTILKIS